MKKDETIYAGEAQLAGWSDSHQSGVKVTFWLPDASDLDKFRALTVRKGNTAGHRVMLAVVEIGETEERVPPPEPTKHHEQQPKPRNGPYCIEAIDLCRMPLFQQWVSLEAQVPATEANAKGYILAVLGIGSRKEIDGDDDIVERFINDIRVPFMHWQREQVETRE